MKKIAPWILIPLAIVVLQALSEATKSPPDFSEPKFFAPDDAEIRFYNVRQLAYDREDRNDAGVRIFRYKKRPQSPEVDVQAALLISPLQDRAYIKVELQNLETTDSVTFYRTHPDTQRTDSLRFGQGTMMEQFFTAVWLYQALERDMPLQMAFGAGEAKPVLAKPQARQAFRATLEDYFDLVDL